MGAYSYGKWIATDDQGNPVQNATGNLYDPVADPGYTTLLTVDDLNGNPVSQVSTDGKSYMGQEFTADVCPIIWMANGTTPIKLWAPEYFKTAAENAMADAANSATAAQASQAAAEQAAANTTAPTETVVRSVFTTDIADPNSAIASSINLTVSDAVTPAITTAINPGGAARSVMDDQYPNRSTRLKHAPAFALYFPEAEASLQAAATAAKAQPGSTLQLLPGKTYTIPSAVDVTGLTIEMIGATVKVQDGITAPNVFTTTGDLTIIGYNATIDGNKANTTDPGSSAANGNGIKQSGSSWNQLRIVGVNIVNCWQYGASIRRSGSETDPINVPSCPVDLDSVAASSCGTYGIFVGFAGKVQLLNCSGESNGNTGALINMCRSVRLIGGDYNNNVSAHGLCLQYCLDTSIIGPTANYNGTHGICMGGGVAANAQSKHGTILGATANGNGSCGIAIDLTVSGATGVPQVWMGSITGNTCNGNQAHGISLTTLSLVQISSNMCNGNTLAGIALNSSNLCGVESNTCTGNGNYGIGTFATANAASGSFFGSHTIGSNNLNGNALGKFHSDTAYHQPPIFTDAAVPIIKATDTDRNNVGTPADDPHLTVAVDKNAVYAVEAWIVYNATTTADLKVGWTIPGGGSTFTWSGGAAPTNATAASNIVNTTHTNAGSAFGGLGSDVAALVFGQLTVGPNDGTFAFNWSQSTAEASDCYVRAGSWLKLTRIA